MTTEPEGKYLTAHLWGLDPLPMLLGITTTHAPAADLGCHRSAQSLGAVRSAQSARRSPLGAVRSAQSAREHGKVAVTPANAGRRALRSVGRRRPHRTRGARG